MSTPELSVSAVDRLLRDYVKHSGSGRSSYWLNEEAATLIGERAGHYPRRNAAAALLAGGVITLDLGGWNGTGATIDRVTLDDVLALAREQS